MCILGRVLPFSFPFDRLKGGGGRRREVAARKEGRVVWRRREEIQFSCFTQTDRQSGEKKKFRKAGRGEKITFFFLFLFRAWLAMAFSQKPWKTCWNLVVLNRKLLYISHLLFLGEELFLGQLSWIPTPVLFLSHIFWAKIYIFLVYIPLSLLFLHFFNTAINQPPFLGKKGEKKSRNKIKFGQRTLSHVHCR